ncbi:MAG TPA: polysaccharide deacetylase family protein, partial [Verrucomicrobiae bacterium]|nr:polysaccharide deacetylase family protein [Verrucomicrobiae bacterium]
PYYKTNTSPAVFRQHVKFLAENGYRTLSLQALASELRAPHSAPRHPVRSVAITFDDGFRNFYTEAFPALQEHGFTATMFLPTAFIGESRRPFAPRASTSAFGRECLTWDEVREMRKSGMHFGSHTVSHPKLVELAWPEIRSEISDSKAEIEQRLGEAVRTFAYPFAYPQMNRQFVARFTDELRSAGYLCCATTQVGRLNIGDDPYRMNRLPVNSLDDLSLFRAKLEGAYDWLAAPQTLVKRIKARGRMLRQPSLEASTEVSARLN